MKNFDKGSLVRLSKQMEGVLLGSDPLSSCLWLHAAYRNKEVLVVTRRANEAEFVVSRICDFVVSRICDEDASALLFSDELEAVSPLELLALESE